MNREDNQIDLGEKRTARTRISMKSFGSLMKFMFQQARNPAVGLALKSLDKLHKPTDSVTPVLGLETRKA
jgi:hypothetical protein